MEEKFERYHPDMEAFHQQMKTDPCFVCEIVAGTNDLPQHFVYKDDRAVAFLDAFPRAYGYTLVAPKEHREQVKEMAALAERIGRRVERIYPD